MGTVKAYARTMGTKDEEMSIIRCPYVETMKDLVIPDVSYPAFILECLRKNQKLLADRVAAVDVLKNKTLLYKDIEPIAIRFASALTKKGFKKGDVFFYSTYNAALLYGIQIGVWLCGGCVRGCFQREDPREMGRQMADTKSRFILCDPETLELVKEAAKGLDWPVNYFSIDGDVDGASPVEDMAFNDDGSAYDKDITINPAQDIVFIPSTNGSTGNPKGALHTHRSLIAVAVSMGAPIDLESEKIPHVTLLAVIGNFNVGPILLVLNTLMLGRTFVTSHTFEKESFFKQLEIYKPNALVLFPYLANIISRSPDFESIDVSFVRAISVGGSVVDTATVENLSASFPSAKINVMYGMTEALLISSNNYGVHHKILRDPDKAKMFDMKILKVDGQSHVSSGPLLPLVEAKVVDVENGNALERGSKGRILVRSPYIMKGYLRSNEIQGNQSTVDADGWLDTGDFGFITEDGHVFVIDRLKLIFKYLMHQISPADIEKVIQEHPSVQSVGVVGVPNPETTSAARAYIVIKPECTLTDEEIKKHVADKTPSYKHLHGGVRFTDKLPVTRGGKLDRATLIAEAIKETKKSS
ncbi:4-coumarate--CoA ligase-like 1 [Ischnura elegans]|uniref:4-coumarate--CoA ligase-like 1 n=1 Tax=Ischnura elegans TaxID=197161 RepID=UPI001ED872CE|nr:4-coumarate--CoA ligase-like 1 [Ischnura elegans]